MKWLMMGVLGLAALAGTLWLIAAVIFFIFGAIFGRR